MWNDVERTNEIQFCGDVITSYKCISKGPGEINGLHVHSQHTFTMAYIHIHNPNHDYKLTELEHLNSSEPAQ